MKRARKLAAIAAVLFGAAVAATGLAVAQTPLPRAVPNLRLASSGGIEAMLRQPDGGVIVAGYFTLVNGVARTGIARLRPDATLDLDWNARNNGIVEHLALGPDGSIYFAGNLSYVANQPRPGLAKLRPDGTLDAAWKPPSDSSWRVGALAVGADGAVYVGGTFTVGGNTRRLLKLNGDDGAIATGWPAAGEPNEPVLALAVEGDALYAAGGFTAIGGEPRARVARLTTTDGALDAAWRPQFGGQVHEMVTDGVGNVYFGGFFSVVDGNPRDGLAKIDAQGRLDPAWHPTIDGIVNLLAIADGGAVLVGGSYELISGTARSNAAHLSPNDAQVLPELDLAFPRFTQVRAAATLGTPGTQLLGGNFIDVDGEQHLGLVQLEAGVPTATRLGVGTSAYISDIDEQSDGSLIVAGQFLEVNDMPQRYLLRVRPDGSFDEDWRPQVDDGVEAVAVDADDDVYIGGAFLHVDGQPVTRVAKLDGATARRLPWNPQLNGRVYALEIDGDGRLYIGGEFFTVDGLPRGAAARFTAQLELTAWNPGLTRTVRAILPTAGGVYLGNDGGLGRFALSDGTRDAAWDPAANGRVAALSVDSLGRLYAAGDFTRIGGNARRSLARLDPVSASADMQWTPAAATDYVVVHALADDGQGALYVGGLFATLGGQTRPSIARISLVDGRADPDWNPYADGSVFALHLTASGDVAVGGYFGTLGGQPRDGLAVLPRRPPERLPQTVDFAEPAPGPYVFGGSAGNVEASASSGLPVRYDSLTPTLCSIDGDSGQIEILGAGTCIASADQDGDDVWLPAAQATQEIVIAKAAQAPLELDIEPSTLTVGGNAALTTLGGTGIGAVTYAVTAGAGVCEIVPPATLHALAAGSCTVTATKAADHDHLAASVTAAARVLAPLPQRVFGNGFE